MLLFHSSLGSLHFRTDCEELEHPPTSYVGRERGGLSSVLISVFPHLGTWGWGAGRLNSCVDMLHLHELFPWCLYSLLGPASWAWLGFLLLGPYPVITLDLKE